MSATPNSPRAQSVESASSSSPATPRRKVRRLSQLEPVHIAVLKQEYTTQIKEAAKAAPDSPAQKEHYDKAKKIKILLEKYELMLKQQQQKQTSPQTRVLENESVPTSIANLASSGANDKSASAGPSISQQMAANVPRHNYSEDNKSSSPDLTTAGSPQSAEASTDTLSAQLNRFKQMEKDIQSQLDRVQQQIRQSASSKTYNLELRQQEQNLRNKRDHFKSIVLQITQHLQVRQHNQAAQKQQSSDRSNKPVNTETDFHRQTDFSHDASQRSFSPSFLSDSFKNTGIPGNLSHSKYMSTPPGPTAGYVNSGGPNSTSQYSRQVYNRNDMSLPQQNKPVRIPGKVGRPPLASTLAGATARQQQMSEPLHARAPDIPEKVYNKRKINQLIKDLMPEDNATTEVVIDNDVEDLVGDLVEEFVANITEFSCRLAKHRKAARIEAKDVQIHLERNWNLRVPGFPGDELSIVRKSAPTKGFQTTVDGVNVAKIVGSYGQNKN